MGEKQKKIKKTLKARAWTFIIYEDSTNIAEFEEKIQDEGRKGLRALYVKHDKDMNPDGTKKKIHYHVILIWEGPTTQKNALEVAQSLANVSYIEAVRDLTGASRYLTHMDNAEKHQYSKDSVITIGNVDYTELINSSRNDRIEISKMMTYIRDNEVVHFHEFVYYCMEHEPEWFRIATERSTFAISSVIKSQYFAKKEEEEERRYKQESMRIGPRDLRYIRLIDKETGEITYSDKGGRDL